MGAVPAAKVVVAATVGSEDAPDAMAESGRALGLVAASVKVSEGAVAGAAAVVPGGAPLAVPVAALAAGC